MLTSLIIVLWISNLSLRFYHRSEGHFFQKKYCMKRTCFIFILWLEFLVHLRFLCPRQLPHPSTPCSGPNLQTQTANFDPLRHPVSCQSMYH